MSTAVEPTVERTADHRLGRSLVVGGLIGVVLMAGSVFIVSLTVGAGFAGSLGIAAVCAVWGGLGFGCMFGAIANIAGQERREAEAFGEVASAAGRASVAGGIQLRRGDTL